MLTALLKAPRDFEIVERPEKHSMFFANMVPLGIRASWRRRGDSAP